MLYTFLIENREKILALVGDKLADNHVHSPGAKKELPRLYDHLIHELENEAKGLRQSPSRKHGGAAARHGMELSRLGFTVEEVVKGYALLRQVITEIAQATNKPISAGEFAILNLSLDTAITEALTGFTERTNIDWTQKMGFLAHELRNALSCAIIAHSMIKKGITGTGGSNTHLLLERNLFRMREILDRAFSKVRMQHQIATEKMKLIRLTKCVEVIEAATTQEAVLKGLTLKVNVNPHLQVYADEHTLVSALSNLVHNAIKYSQRGGTIWLRSKETDRDAVLEVEDQCGGLPKGKVAELFKPFTQKNSDRTGLGLGLSICRQAVALNGGMLKVRDIPGKGCGAYADIGISPIMPTAG